MGEQESILVPILSVPSNSTSLTSILILFAHLCLGLATGFFRSGVHTKILCETHMLRDAENRWTNEPGITVLGGDRSTVPDSTYINRVLPRTLWSCEEVLRMLRYESQQAQHTVKETRCHVLYRHAASHCKRFSSRHVSILSRKTSLEGFIKPIWYIASIQTSCFPSLIRRTYTATALTVKHALTIILNYECNLC
jgi:hypothetical protein